LTASLSLISSESGIVSSPLRMRAFGTISFLGQIAGVPAMTDSICALDLELPASGSSLPRATVALLSERTFRSHM
jgi:hypothetical protein